jgi:hypothetical protein
MSLTRVGRRHGTPPGAMVTRRALDARDEPLMDKMPRNRVRAAEKLDARRGGERSSVIGL